MTKRLAIFILLAAAQIAPAQDDKLGGKTCGEWLMVLKSDKQFKLRRASLIVLEVYGAKTRGVVAGVIEALEKDAEPEIRREAAMLLGRMGSDAKEAVPYLAEALKKDKSDVVREAAALALSEKLNPFAHEQVLVMAGALKDAHAGTRAAAATALNALGDKARLALPQLIEVVKDKKADRVPRLYAVKLVSRLQNNEPETGVLLAAIVRDDEAAATIRVAAAEGLGRREKTSKEELVALGHLLQQKSVDLRRAGATALATLGEQTAPLWSQVRDRFKDEDNTVRFQLIRVASAVGREHKDAVELLGQLAQKDEHVENRLAAIGELGQLGAAAAPAAKVLESLSTQDARAAIRDAAAAALKRIQQ